jgi:hypothetical protein
MSELMSDVAGSSKDLDIPMREPASEYERQCAILMCRMNSYRFPLTGEPHHPDISVGSWKNFQNLAPHEVFLWMWNHGRDQWIPK